MPARRVEATTELMDWLLEADDEQPGVRYFALQWLFDMPATASAVVAARRRVMSSGPVPAILAAQQPGGSWEEPDFAFGPQYRGSAWALTFLAELGADGADARVRFACEWVLAHVPAVSGGVGYGSRASKVIHCANGNVTRALVTLGALDDPRTKRALQWAADATLGRGSPEYRASGTSGPLFACGANGKLPCGWGAVKELRAFAAVPPRRRTRDLRDAIEAAVEFLLAHDLAVADFPTATTISGRWFNLSFPAGYQADVLELLLALAELRRLRDPRAQPGLARLLGVRDADGRWSMGSTLNGKMHADVEQRGEPSKWLTLRALRVLRDAPRARRAA